MTFSVLNIHSLTKDMETDEQQPPLEQKLVMMVIFTNLAWLIIIVSACFSLFQGLQAPRICILHASTYLSAVETIILSLTYV